MYPDLKFGVIGAGNMAGAILNSILKNGIFSKESIFINDKDKAKKDSYKDKGFNVTDDPETLVLKSDVILISVKPQDLEDLLHRIGKNTSGKCLLTIAAGISTEYYHKRTAEGTYVIRIMPNTPIMAGCGASAIAEAKDVPPYFFDLCVRIFESSGAVSIIDESLLCEIISVNGSSPAYFFKMIDAMVKSAVGQGIPYDVALNLATKAMEGSALLLSSSKKSPCELIAQVSSKGGTTIAALNELDAAGFDKTIDKAMKACTKRAYELGK